MHYLSHINCISTENTMCTEDVMRRIARTIKRHKYLEEIQLTHDDFETTELLRQKLRERNWKPKKKKIQYHSGGYDFEGKKTEKMKKVAKNSMVKQKNHTFYIKSKSVK